MPYLKAGYFIDELHHHLVNTVGESVLNDFYERNLPFKADGFSKKIRISTENPLIKVAWNIITRGRPTRASIDLSQYILGKHLGTATEEGEEEEPVFEEIATARKGNRIFLDLPWPELKEAEPEPLIRLLEHFHKLSVRQVEQEYGDPYLTLFQILKDLQASAQIQQLLLLMYLSYFPSEEFYVHIKGLDTELAGAIVQDLNTLFDQLNGLLSKKEKPLSPIVNEDVIKAHTVIYESKPQLGFRVTSIAGKVDPEKEEKIPYLTKIFTDRRITYASIGFMKEVEVPATPAGAEVEAVAGDERKEEEQETEVEVEETNASKEVLEQEAAANTGDGEEESEGEESAIENEEAATGPAKSVQSMEATSDTVSAAQAFSYKDDKQEKALQYILRNVFRKAEFQPTQEVIIDRLFQEEDVLGILPAGIGTTLPYQVCGLLQPGISMILEPGEAFNRSRREELQSHAIHNTLNFVPSLDIVERRKRLKSLLNSESQYVFVNPEWFKQKDFRKVLNECSKKEVYFSYGVLDEVHAVSEWGHDFRYAYVGAVQEAKRWCRPKEKELVLYGTTAPATLDVLKDIKREMECSEDAIVSVPASALESAEHNIRILKAGPELNESLRSDKVRRIQEIGNAKHQDLIQFLQSVPAELTGTNTGEEAEQSDYFEKDEYGNYTNTGLLFCPSVSADHKNGVFSVKQSLETAIKQLDIGVIADGQELTTASSEEDEEKKGRTNSKNLWITTHDAGIALQRPNIRYTCHYTFPDTIEDFYQEAGVAGVGRPSISAILYHPDDLLTKYEQYEAASIAFSKEKEIIQELLSTVPYADGFHLHILESKARSKYPEIAKLRLVEPKQLNILGSDDQTHIASISLEEGLKLDADYVQNFDKAKSAKIGRFVINLLKKESGGTDPAQWLKTRSTQGIIPQMKKDPKGTHHLRVGLENEMIQKITAALQFKNEGVEPAMIRAAYRQSMGPDDFIEELKMRYQIGEGSGNVLKLTEDEASKIISGYKLIRDSEDILHALFRLKMMGIIDEYVVNEPAGYVKMEFKAKKGNTYLRSFKDYLTRYFGNGTAGKWIKKARANEQGTEPEKVIFTFIDFIEKEIYDRKKGSMDHMKYLCEIGQEQGSEAFKEMAASHYAAKYSGAHYLPKDTENGKVENAGIVKKYLRFINNPPDGQGGELTNTMHLKNACEKFREEISDDNASVNILMAYSYFTAEIQEDEEVESILSRPLVQKAIELYSQGFKKLEAKEPWIEMVQLLGLFSTKVLDLNPGLKPYLVPLVEKILIHRTSSRLKRFLNKITSHE